MIRFSAERWLPVGATLTGVGATAAIAYWIYCLEAEPSESFWRLPGYLSLAVAGVGLVCLTIGFFAPARGPVSQQHQRGGDESRNIQAGRDVHFSARRDSDDQ
jgi:hypothetical protein